MSIGLSSTREQARHCRAAAQNPSTGSPERCGSALAFITRCPHIGLAMFSSIPLLPQSERTADRLAEAAARAEHGKERIVLTRDGKPVAAVVPIEDLETLEAEDAHWSKAADEAAAAWEAQGRPAGIPIGDIARNLGIDLTADPNAAP
ncbi:MAG: type II toxin-antitoxin system Phd/YefM family antitoxin [Stellaceae bacterium]